jgi:hypothetical protein
MNETQTTAGEDDALLTTQDVADRYRVHPRTVPGLVKEKRIPAPVEGWPGSTKRWLKSEVVAHIRAMRKRELAEQVS